MRFPKWRIVLVAAAGLTVAAGSAAAEEPRIQPAKAASATISDEHWALTDTYLAANLTLEGAQGWRKVFVQSGNFAGCGCLSDKRLLAKLSEGWIASIDAEFDAASIVMHVREAVAHQFSKDELKQLIAMRSSKLGQRLKRAELEYLKWNERADQNAAMLRMTQAGKRLGADPERSKLIRETIAGTDGLRHFTDSMLNISMGTCMGLMAAAPPNSPRLSADETGAQIEAQRPMFEQVFDGPYLTSYAAMYDGISNSDLKTLLRNLKKPLLRKSVNAANSAFSEAMKIQALRIGARLAKEMAAEKI